MGKNVAKGLTDRVTNFGVLPFRIGVTPKPSVKVKIPEGTGSAAGWVSFPTGRRFGKPKPPTALFTGTFSRSLGRSFTVSIF